MVHVALPHVWCLFRFGIEPAEEPVLVANRIERRMGLVKERDRLDAFGLQGVEFLWPGLAKTIWVFIAMLIDPKTQLIPNRVAFVDDQIAIAALWRVIVPLKRKETGRAWVVFHSTITVWCEVAEQLRAIFDDTIAISV